MTSLLEIPPVRPTDIHLRGYQKDAIEAVRNEYLKGIRSTLLVMATGLGKCVDPNTWVWSRGLWRFGEIFDVAERIAGPAGPAVVSNWYDDGIREGHKVTLDCGLVIDGTPAHRVWVRNPDGYEGWRHLGELADDDRIAVGRDRADFGSSAIPLDEAYALGLLIADGSLVDQGTTRRLQIDKQGPVLNAVLPVMERWRSLAGARWGNGTTVKEFSEKHAVATSYAPDFHAMLRERFGIEEWAYSESREVPPVVLTGTRDVVIAFLKGYFDGDGYCSPTPAVSTSSPVLAQQVHMMLLGLGIFATHKVKETSGLPSHEIAVWDYDGFARIVGFTPYGLKKDRRFAILMSKPRNTNKDTVPGVGGLIHAIARRIKGKRRCGNEWRMARSYYSGEKMPGYDMLKAWHASAPDCPERGELARIIADHYAWSPIRSVEPSTIRRIDCQVEEQHAFIGNGIVNHNTVSFGMVARMVAEKGGRTLVLAHRGELIDQAAETLARIGLDPGIEKASNYARAIYEPNVVVATVQTMQRERLLSWPADFFKLVIVDEAHHATAKSYKNILKYFSSARILGVTATAERTDEGALGDVFESVAYEYTLWEAMTAPAPGPYLSRLRFVQCDVGIDLRDIRTTAGDLNAADLEEAIRPHVETLANAIKQEIGERKTLVFTPDVGSAMAMATALDSIGVRSKWVSGESPDRKEIIDGFKRGDFQALANCSLLLEGFDAPDVSAIALCRPTKSRPLFTQIVGRGTRLAQNKDNCLLIDFAWLTAKHDLVKPTELFGSTACDPETAAIAQEVMKAKKGMDLHDVIEEAKEEKKRRAELRIKAKRKELKYRKVAYDPLTQMGTLGIKMPKSATSNQGTVTGYQRERLERWGFKGVESMSKSQASRVIDQYGQRLRQGLATMKQVNVLIRDGMPAEEARNKTIREASDLIDVIMNGKKNGHAAPPPPDEEPMTWVA